MFTLSLVLGWVREGFEHPFITYGIPHSPPPPSLVPPGLLRTACLGQGNRSMVTDVSPRAPWGQMVDPCEPKATKMTPKWKPKGIVGGVKNVSVSISAKKC